MWRPEGDTALKWGNPLVTPLATPIVSLLLPPLLPQEVLDRGGYCSPMGEPSRASMNSNDFEFRLSSPAPEMASVSDR